jgi:hypothetical protein
MLHLIDELEAMRLEAHMHLRVHMYMHEYSLGYEVRFIREEMMRLT